MNQTCLRQSSALRPSMHSPGKRHSRFRKKTIDLLAVTGKKVARFGASGENGNVAFDQVPALCFDQAQQMRVVFHPYPQPVKQTIKIKGVAQVIRMKGL